MTVSSSTNKVSYSGNGTLTTFAYSFKIFDEGDLTVILRASDGTETVQTITTNYTVTGAGSESGGNVEFVTAPTSSQTVVILRELDLNQGLDLVPNDPFPAQSLEESLDKLTFMVQQHDEELGRAIKASKTTTISTVEFTDSASDRASKIMAFDTSGDLDLTQEIGTFRGDWAASTNYGQRDIVKDTNNNNIYIANTAHTSSGSVPLSSNADIAKWDLLVDAASATTSATNAATSESNAANSAADAEKLAINAEDSQFTLSDGVTTGYSALHHKEKALDAQAAAEAAQTAAETAQTAAETAYDNFDDRYLGDKASDPAVDNDGDPLVDGALYFDTTNNVLKFYDLGNTAWKQTTPTSAQQTNIDAVAADATDIGTVATNIASVNSVAGIDAAVSTVSGISSEVSTVSGISTEVSAVAADATDIGTVATDLAGSDNIGTVAGSIANVNLVGGSITNVNTVATNLSGVNSFAERYRVEDNNPTTSLDAGDLAYVVNDTVLKYYNGTSWQSISPGIGAVSDDSNPSLGGNLNLASNNITGTGNVDITGTVSADNLGEHTITAVASGALANGDVVSLNSDGTVTASGDVVTSTSVGSQQSVTGYGLYNDAFWLDDDRFVLIYSSSTNQSYGTDAAVVGTVSGTSITFGTPAQLTTNTSSRYAKMVSIGNSKFLVHWTDTTNTHKVIVGTVSGTSITFGTAVSQPTNLYTPDMVYDTDQETVILNGRDSGNSGYLTSIPITISGTTPTVGSAVVAHTVNSYERRILYDASIQKHIIYYQNDSNLDRPYAVVGTLSGGTLSYGTPVQIGTRTAIDEIVATTVSSGVSVVSMTGTNNSTYYAYVGTVSGTSISFGAEHVTNFGSDIHTRSINYSSANDELMLFIDDFGDDQIKVRFGTISGTTVTFDSATDYTILTYDGTYGIQMSNGWQLPFRENTHKMVIHISDNTNTQTDVYIYQLEYTINNAANYIGVADAAYSDGATATIQILGSIDDAQTGLTTGSTYFVADDGSLSTTNNGRKIGRAISATEILIDTAMSGPEMNAYLGGLV
jgi:hypothetical protein